MIVQSHHLIFYAYDPQVSQTTFDLSLRRRVGLILSRNLYHIAHVCEGLIGFFGILWISSTGVEVGWGVGGGVGSYLHWCC